MGIYDRVDEEEEEEEEEEEDGEIEKAEVSMWVLTYLNDAIPVAC